MALRGKRARKEFQNKKISVSELAELIEKTYWRFPATRWWSIFLRFNIVSYHFVLLYLLIDTNLLYNNSNTTL